jgi:uncharacterized membrane protein
MYLSGGMTLLLSPLWRSYVTYWSAILVGVAFLLPTAIDGTTQMFGDRESTNRLRILTGVPLGIGVVWVLYGIVFALPRFVA